MEPVRVSEFPEGHRASARRDVSEHLKLEITLLDADADEHETEERPPLGAETMRSVLVVDDDPDMCSYVARCLKATNFPIRYAGRAADGIEALEKLAAMKVDLVITDVAMPRMDGLVLCERLRKDDEHSRLPVLLMSGEVASEDVRRRIRSDPAVGVLAKPFSARTLCDAVEHLMGRQP